MTQLPTLKMPRTAQGLISYQATFAVSLKWKITKERNPQTRSKVKVPLVKRWQCCIDILIGDCLSHTSVVYNLWTFLKVFVWNVRNLLSVTVLVLLIQKGHRLFWGTSPDHNEALCLHFYQKLKWKLKVECKRHFFANKLHIFDCISSCGALHFFKPKQTPFK